jgi:tetraacyldisaccharide 4'-kinase
VWIRGFLFDNKIIKSKEYPFPIIGVGNITVGGSGKTPHVEYLVKMLQDEMKVAVLSRGYKRDTKGFVLAKNGTTMREIGDEPFQMHKKFPDITVAVDANRCRGIETIMSMPDTNDTGVIILDDAYQHRYITPGLNILLVDYHRLISNDTLLPAGRLREPASATCRADIVIMTKCPTDMKPMDYRILQRAMNLMPFQNMYYTTMVQKPLRPLFPDEAPEIYDETQLPAVLMITGIASPEHMIADFEGKCKKLVLMKFPDHHYFTASDVEAINLQYRMMEKPAVIITTEKDGVRLTSTPGLSDIVRKSIYIQPIEVQFIQDEDKFINQITKYVHKNSRNGSMAEETGRQHGIAVPRPTPQPRPRPLPSQRPESTPLSNAEDSNRTRNGSRPSYTGNRGRTGIPIQRHPSFPGFDS